MTNFALIGAGGYIAPRHMQAINDTGNQLVAAVDRNDSVGVLDRYFPEARFFVEIERFDRYLEKLRRQGDAARVRYVSVCSPNYMHDAHVRLGLRLHADVICEKPLVITPWNLDALAELEREYGQRVYNVLQLRLLPSLVELKQKLDAGGAGKRARIELSYVTRRGPWYFVSWKGDESKSGGVAMNIGVHFFDLLLWLFGACQRSEVHLREPGRMSGMLELEKADVVWFLSVQKEDLPEGYLEAGKPAFRSLTMDGTELEFSGGFTELHTEVYREVLAGRGFGIEDARASVELVHRVRNQEITARPDLSHPALAGLTRGSADWTATDPPPP